MAFLLVDKENKDNDLMLNGWHWRTIVSEIRRLDVIDAEVAENLQYQWCGFGLSKDEAGIVADALERTTLPRLSEDDRLLLDGTEASTPDDYNFHKADPAKNYSTNAEVLRMFIDFCRSSQGFELL